MNIKIITLLLVTSIVSSQLCAQDISAERRKHINAYLKQQGLPELDSGFTMDDSPTQGISKFKRPDRIDRYDDNVKQFLDFEIVANRQYKKLSSDHNPHHSHLRHTLKEFNSIMAYTFVGAPSNIVTKHIGYAPYVTYVENQGWVGGIHFFKHDDLICRFSENNIKLSHAAYKESADKIGTEVNGKYTMLTIVGNKDSGYMYHVDWFDINYFRSLECATRQYNDSILNKTIEMAKNIDSSQ